MNNIYRYTVLLTCLGIVILSYVIGNYIVNPNEHLAEFICLISIFVIGMISKIYNHLTILKDLELGSNIKIQQIRQSQELLIELPLAEAMSQVFDSVNLLDRFVTYNLDSSNKIIQGNIKNSIGIWKLRISPYIFNSIFKIKFSHISDNQTKCVVDVWPRLYFYVFDAGQNILNMETVISQLKK